MAKGRRVTKVGLKQTLSRFSSSTPSRSSIAAKNPVVAQTRRQRQLQLGGEAPGADMVPIPTPWRSSALHALDIELRSVAVAAKAVPMKAYMKNNFEFLGVSQPQRKVAYESFKAKFGETERGRGRGAGELGGKSEGTGGSGGAEGAFTVRTEEDLLSWVQLLWKQPYREFQHVAIDELIRSQKLLTKEKGAKAVIELVKSKSWWDSVDLLAANVLGGIYHPARNGGNSSNGIDGQKSGVYTDLAIQMQQWIDSENMWINRTAILVQLKYKDHTNVDLLKSAIAPHMQSKEFFLQKAIGWALREYAKTNMWWVKEFVEANKASMKPLSVREALKHF